jgi:hypothetical protein
MTPAQFLAGEAIILFASAQPSTEWVPVSFNGLKWPEREADHSPLSNAEIVNAWCVTSRPPDALMVWCLDSLSVIQAFGFVLAQGES